MPIHLPSSKTPPHILSLPTELRLEIFRHLLLTKHTKRAAPYQPAIPHALQPALLRVCHQFRREAQDVLYRENVFVHIMTNYYHLQADFNNVGLSAVTDQCFARQFPYYSLRASLSFHQPHCFPVEPHTHHFMLPAEDLQRFCSMFWLLKVRRHLQMSLCLTVLTPGGGARPSIAKQESLVLPFQELWHISRAAVDGHVDPHIAERLKRALTETLPRSTPERLRFVATLTHQGDEFSQQRDHFQGAITYYKAFAAGLGVERKLMLIGQPTQNIPQPYDVMSKITLAFLKLGAWRDAEESADIVVALCMGTADVLGLVIAYFRKGIARKMLGNFHGSKHDIDWAVRWARSLWNYSAVINYLLLEQNHLWNPGLDDKGLKIQRAKFGFI